MELGDKCSERRQVQAFDHTLEELKLLLGVVEPPLVSVYEEIAFESPCLVGIESGSHFDRIAVVLARYDGCEPSGVDLST